MHIKKSPPLAARNAICPLLSLTGGAWLHFILHAWIVNPSLGSRRFLCARRFWMRALYQSYNSWRALDSFFSIHAAYIFSPTHPFLKPRHSSQLCSHSRVRLETHFLIQFRGCMTNPLLHCWGQVFSVLHIDFGSVAKYNCWLELLETNLFESEWESDALEIYILKALKSLLQ